MSKELEAVRTGLADVSHGPLEGEYAHVRGRWLFASSRWKDALLELERAVALGVTHRHDELATDAWLTLVSAGSENIEHQAVNEAWLRQARAYVERFSGGRGRWRLRLADATARTEDAAGRHQKAIDVLSAAIESAEVETPEVWDMRLLRAAAALSLSRAEAAKADYDYVLPRYVKRWGARHPKVASTHLALGQMYVDRLGDLMRGETHLKKALELFTAAYGRKSLRVANVYETLSLVPMYQGDYASALAQLEQSLEIERALGPTSPRTARTLGNVGAIRHLLGRYEGAVAAYREALPLQEGRLDPDHPDVAIVASNLGESLLALGRIDEAHVHFSRAQQSLELRLGPDHPDLAYPTKGLGLVALARGERTKARTFLERALRLTPAKGGDPQERAEIGWGLARALGRSGHGRALAREALAHYRELGPRWSTRVGQIEAWLRR